MYEFVFSMSNF